MEKNWSISFEQEEYERDSRLLIQDAYEAVNKTKKGFYVNIVTPANFGHPDNYLTSQLIAQFNEKITTKFIDQCGCGGYVLRVWKN